MREEYLQAIIPMLTDVDDIEFLDLIYQLLRKKLEHLHDTTELVGVQLTE